jgi:cytochrome c biogenesis protein CcmG/thiol:disulfide interchange protein DsbE
VPLVALAGVLALVALLAYGLASKGTSTSIDSRLAAGTRPVAPATTLPDLNSGRAVSLASYRGRVLVLNFWASWCDPCRSEAKVLERGWKESGGRDVLFLGLDGQDASEDARAFISSFRLTFPHVRDPTKGTARDWGVTGLPETFFVAASGRVVGHVIGTVDPRQLRDGVAAARAGHPAGAQRGGEQRPTR